jgi:hypothetical protein
MEPPKEGERPMETLLGRPAKENRDPAQTGPELVIGFASAGEGRPALRRKIVG